MAFIRMKETAFGRYQQLVEAKRPKIVIDGKKRRGAPRQKVILTLPRGTYCLETALSYWQFICNNARMPTVAGLRDYQTAEMEMEGDYLEHKETASMQDALIAYVHALPKATGLQKAKAKEQVVLLKKYIAIEARKQAGFSKKLCK